MATVAGGGMTDGQATTSEIVVTVIPAETPEIAGRLLVPGCLPATTVGEIRLKIQQLIPSHPALQRLRLICAGVLLARDEQTLEQIAGPELLRVQKAITIHLALRPGPDSSRDSGIPGAPPAAAAVPQPAPVFNGVPATQTRVLPRTDGAGLAPAGGPVAEEHRQRMRMHQDLLRQHLQASQAALHAAARQQQVAIPPPRWPAPPVPIPMHDFQRHLNEQHTARQGTLENPTSGESPRAENATGPHIGIQQQVPNHLPASPAPPLQSFTAGPFPAPIIPRGFVAAHMHMNGIRMPGITPYGAQPLATVNRGMASSREYDKIYLLSGPNGYQAMILGPPIAVHAPTFGTTEIHATGPSPVNLPAVPVPAVRTLNAADLGPGGHLDERNAPRPIGLSDLLSLLLPFGMHAWLLVRLIFFAFILTWGADWRRTIYVSLGVVIIFLSQTGLLRPLQELTEQAWVPVRRHIEGLVREIDAERRESAAAATGTVQPDPQQTAERLLRRQREQGIFRRAERSAVLFVASFVPGVGEAQVAAREEVERERRRVVEEREAEARRAQEQQEAADEQAEAASVGDRPADEPGRTVHEGADPSPGTGPAEDSASSLRQRQARVEEASDEES